MVIGLSSSADGLFNEIDPADIAVATVDDDTAEVIVTASALELLTEGGLAADYSLVLASEPTANVVITIPTDLTMM